MYLFLFRERLEREKALALKMEVERAAREKERKEQEQKRRALEERRRLVREPPTSPHPHRPLAGASHSFFLSASTRRSSRGWLRRRGLPRSGKLLGREKLQPSR